MRVFHRASDVLARWRAPSVLARSSARSSSVAISTAVAFVTLTSLVGLFLEWQVAHLVGGDWHLRGTIAPLSLHGA